MSLVDVVVANQAEIDGSITVKADFGKERVFIEIPRIALDDYFPSRTLDDAQRRALVESNKEAIATTMLQKCEQKAWRDVNRAGSMIKQLDFTKADLFAGPRLTDARLMMEEKAEYSAAFR